MLFRVLRLVVLTGMLTACVWGNAEITPDKLVGNTVILTLETGAFPSSGIALQFVSSKDLVWRLEGNLGLQTGSSDYLVSMVNDNTMLITWRSEQERHSYVLTLNFHNEMCFLVRIDQGKNLLSTGVFTFE